MHEIVTFKKIYIYTWVLEVHNFTGFILRTVNKLSSYCCAFKLAYSWNISPFSYVSG